LLLKHTPSETDVDISMGILPFEKEMVQRDSTKSFANLSVRLPMPEDLIIMKAIAHRPKDLEDIRTVAAKFPNLDTGRIKRWVTAFGDAMEDPGLWDEIGLLLK
jgi:hypothetical protein